MEIFSQALDIIISLATKNIIPILIFIVFFVIDFGLGVAKGIYIEGVSSSKLRLSVPKFCGYIGMILSCLLLDMLAVISFDFEYSPITLITVIVFCLFEIKSIIENATTLGIKVPKIVTNSIEKIEKIFNSDEGGNN